jgi:hypothetical protein
MSGSGRAIERASAPIHFRLPWAETIPGARNSTVINIACASLELDPFNIALMNASHFQLD